MSDNLLFLPVEEVSKAVGQNGEIVGRVQMSEQGYTGLKISNGRLYEELKQELQFPWSIVTYKQMSYDATISAALSYYESMMLKARWNIKTPEDATEEEKAQAVFFKQCLSDMTHSWQDFIQEVSSMNSHGFSVHEIVLRKRLRSKGSKYNDGMVGIEKLPIRSQETIDKWIYSEDGRDLIGLRQNLNLSGYAGRVALTQNKEIIIPRKKFLLFRTGKRKDSPQGESILRNCYFAWKYKTLIEEQEAIGVQRDLAGVPHAEVPATIMATDAGPEAKAQLQMWQNIVRNLHNNQQSGLVTPLVYDEVTKQPLYKFSLLKNEGGKAYDTSAIKQYYMNSILTAMHCDVLIMGQSNTGSYALGSIKGTMAAVAVESKLREISNVINTHLIPMLGEANGWDLTRLPELTFEDLESTSLEETSKYIQRIGAVGYLPRTLEVVNKVLDGLGLDALPEDTNLDDVLPEKTTKSGDGMKQGLGSGTGDATGVAGDASSTNADNTA